jgi:hypothetical protein
MLGAGPPKTRQKEKAPHSRGFKNASTKAYSESAFRVAPSCLSGVPNHPIPARRHVQAERWILSLFLRTAAGQATTWTVVPMGVISYSSSTSSMNIRMHPWDA